jgi:hypothetical protein
LHAGAELVVDTPPLFGSLRTLTAAEVALCKA